MQGKEMELKRKEDVRPRPLNEEKGQASVESQPAAAMLHRNKKQRAQFPLRGPGSFLLCFRVLATLNTLLSHQFSQKKSEQCLFSAVVFFPLHFQDLVIQRQFCL